MKNKYSLEQIKEMLESDIPIFILIGKDVLALPILVNYMNMYSLAKMQKPEDLIDQGQDPMLDNLQDVHEAFSDYAFHNETKIPD